MSTVVQQAIERARATLRKQQQRPPTAGEMADAVAEMATMQSELLSYLKNPAVAGVDPSEVERVGALVTRLNAAESELRSKARGEQ